MARKRVYARSGRESAAERAYYREMESVRHGLFHELNLHKAHVMEVLKDTRAELDREIVRQAAGRKSLIPPDLVPLQASVDAATLTMERRLQQLMQGSLQQMVITGKSGTPRALERAAVTGALPEINTLELEIAIANSYRLVSGFSVEMREQLRSVMVRATLGQRTPYETMKEIEVLLRAGGRKVPPGRLAFEAERIFRTEGLRISNMASYERMSQTATQIPRAQKVWLHGGGGKSPREHHAALDGKVIGFNDYFELKDRKGNKWAARFPHDPALPPGEVINCTCTVALVLPGWSLYDKAHAVEKQKAAERARLRAKWRLENRHGEAPEILSGLETWMGVNPEV